MSHLMRSHHISQVLYRNKIYREKEREIYFEELAHVVVGTGKSETCRAGQQAGNPGKSSMLPSLKF